MYIQLVRLKDDGHSTIGTVHVDGKFECFSLEDSHNEPKIYGQTRIPAGTYNIKLRIEGGMSSRYTRKFIQHKGMLWLQDVNNFKWVYIHIGNDEEDTDGCILVGKGCNTSGTGQTISSSKLAYLALYEKAVEQLENGEEVTIQII